MGLLRTKNFSKRQNGFDEPQGAADVAEVGDRDQTSDQAAAEQIEHHLRLGPLGAQLFFRADSCAVTFVAVTAPGETCSVEQCRPSRFAFAGDFRKPEFACQRRVTVQTDIV